MKTKIKSLFPVPALIAVLNLMPAGRVTAQTFTTLHSFTAGSGSYPTITNSDGANPYAGLILHGNPVWHGESRRQFGQWHGVRRQHRWHGFYEPSYFCAR